VQAGWPKRPSCLFYFHPVHDPPQQPGALCVGPRIPDLTEQAPRGSGSDGSRRERTIRKAMVEADPVNIFALPGHVVAEALRTCLFTFVRGVT
jgi:hypothetical protein